MRAEVRHSRGGGRPAARARQLARGRRHARRAGGEEAPAGAGCCAADGGKAAAAAAGGSGRQRARGGNGGWRRWRARRSRLSKKRCADILRRGSGFGRAAAVWSPSYLHAAAHAGARTCGRADGGHWAGVRARERGRACNVPVAPCAPAPPNAIRLTIFPGKTIFGYLYQLRPPISDVKTPLLLDTHIFFSDCFYFLRKEDAGSYRIFYFACRGLVYYLFQWLSLTNLVIASVGAGGKHISK